MLLLNKKMFLFFSIFLSLFLSFLCFVNAENKNNEKQLDFYKQIRNLGIKHYQELRQDLDGEWDLLFIETIEKKTLKVYSGSDNKFLFEDASNSNSFIKAETINLKNSKSPLLLTLWTRGVHAYEIKIYDPNSAKPLLFSQTSDFSIDWNIQNKVLFITVDHGEVDQKTGQRKKKTIQWTGPAKK